MKHSTEMHCLGGVVSIYGDIGEQSRHHQLIEIGGAEGMRDDHAGVRCTEHDERPRSMLIRFSTHDRLPDDIAAAALQRQTSKHRIALQALRAGLKVLAEGKRRGGI
ncbi:hypothetical protein [Curtobacterium sp. 'Ferrero']|uniref:hypothetical protein n=1 Tax=Curtobacterium sp. 'Ferrero' TaxID=2033654 RepID=UPI001141B8E8|nr:hypothetical protein [Curtobacterium sp. 'Ferrero']